MIDIKVYMDHFTKALCDTFGERTLFIGLQGSYGRGEATETSDIDIVVILDEVSAADIHEYNKMLDSLPHRELLCGFLSGKDELMHWETSDLFQFYHDTTPIKGDLAELLPLIDENAVNRAIKIGACNVFHGCVHNMLYKKSEDILKALYKSASFTVQAIAYKQTGNNVRLQKDLVHIVSGNDKAVVETFMKIKNGETICFKEKSEALLLWAQSWIVKT